MKIANSVVLLQIAGAVLRQSYKIYPTLIVDGNMILLVDTGYPGQHAQIREAVEKAGVPFEDLNKVILTHQDIDHIGGLSAILEDAPQRIEVLAHEEEKVYIGTIRNLGNWRSSRNIWKQNLSRSRTSTENDAQNRDTVANRPRRVEGLLLHNVCVFLVRMLGSAKFAA